jgi:hypothetical protein
VWIGSYYRRFGTTYRYLFQDPRSPNTSGIVRGKSKPLKLTCSKEFLFYSTWGFNPPVGTSCPSLVLTPSLCVINSHISLQFWPQCPQCFRDDFRTNCHTNLFSLLMHDVGLGCVPYIQLFCHNCYRMLIVCWTNNVTPWDD